MPYEETCEELTCPPALAKQWRKVWERTAGFEAAAKLLEDADDDDVLLQVRAWRTRPGHVRTEGGGRC